MILFVVWRGFCCRVLHIWNNGLLGDPLLKIFFNEMNTYYNNFCWIFNTFGCFPSCHIFYKSHMNQNMTLHHIHTISTEADFKIKFLQSLVKWLLNFFSVSLWYHILVLGIILSIIVLSTILVEKVAAFKGSHNQWYNPIVWHHCHAHKVSW